MIIHIYQINCISTEGMYLLYNLLIMFYITCVYIDIDKAITRQCTNSTIPALYVYLYINYYYINKNICYYIKHDQEVYTTDTPDDVQKVCMCMWI